MFKPVTRPAPKNVNRYPPATAPVIPSTMSRTMPSPRLFTIFLPRNPAISPSKSNREKTFDLQARQSRSTPNLRNPFVPVRVKPSNSQLIVTRRDRFPNHALIQNKIQHWFIGLLKEPACQSIWLSPDDLQRCAGLLAHLQSSPNPRRFPKT
jgi:hypothetical protein